MNLFVEKGEVVGLVGRSGSGKSVFVKILIGFLDSDKGKIIIDSKSECPFGFSMQENSIYESLTLKQNLVYFSEVYKIPRKLRKERIGLLLDRLKLKDFKNVLVKNLSGGTKKRTDIACALLNDPDILVLDEPFLGLDPFLVSSLSQFILSLSKAGKTIIVSSHRVSELSEICSKLILLRNGRFFKISKSQLGEIY